MPQPVPCRFLNVHRIRQSIHPFVRPEGHGLKPAQMDGCTAARKRVLALMHCHRPPCIPLLVVAYWKIGWVIVHRLRAVLRAPLPVWFYNRPSRFGSARDRACRVLHLVSAIPPCATRLCYALPVAVLRADAGGGLRPRAKALWVFSPARPTVSLALTAVIMGDLVIINILASFRNGSVFLIFCGGARTCDYDKSLTAKSSRLGYHRGFKLPLWRCYALHALMAD